MEDLALVGWTGEGFLGATAMNILAKKARKWLCDSDQDGADGQALVEYSLILLLVILACFAVVTETGDTIRDNLWEQTSNLPFWG